MLTFKYIIIVLTIIFFPSYFSIMAIYCGEIRTAGCITYCNNNKCEFGFCPLDYKDTSSDCRCLSCDTSTYKKLESNICDYKSSLPNQNDNNNAEYRDIYSSYRTSSYSYYQTDHSYYPKTYQHIEHPSYETSLDYLEYKKQYMYDMSTKYPDQYNCKDVECYQKMKESLTKIHDKGFKF